MNKSLFRVFGLVFFAFGFYLTLSSFSSITGLAIIDTSELPFASIWGIVFLVGGSFLLSMASLENRVAKTLADIDNALRSGKVGTAIELEHMAKKLGYSLGHGGNHDDVFDSRGKLITQIPRHSGDLKKGTYRGILKSYKSNYARAG